ncbi:MAG TPA: PLP-dependent aminotransferase family protein [Candidatus Eisenbacteria bacterium]|jgi:GntR family transcriptional regulator/MocR family aminotransferase|nr:PLP-dependent aminotransferase family protein [Candidatus Eisenbacteria bacterium]
MRRVAGTVSPVIAVDRRAERPLHRQIYDGFREGILGRRLRPGQQVPSSRALASELGLSRIPILSAYSQLLAEGYFESRSGAGTFVSTSLPEQLLSIEYRGNGASSKSASGPRRLSSRSAVLPRFNPAPWLFGWGAFAVSQLALDHFPFRIWSSLMTRHCRRIRISSLHFSDPAGSLEFRKAIASYLRTARAVNCEPEQILVVNGSQQALEISARALLDRGDRVWMEEPGYALARQVLQMAGCELVPVPVDEEGMNVNAGIKLCRKARVAFVTPSHQFPLGVTMSASRRLQLLDWAQSTGSWIMEDDYDSEYRYETMPVASLQGIDRHSRVIYIGTFSKTLFPSLRLGYMVVPLDLVDRFVAVRHAMDIYPPHLYQGVLTDFIREGHFARHIRRTRVLYQERRNALMDALRDQFGQRVQLLGGEAGLHLVAKLAKGIKDKQVSLHAAKQKLWLWPLSPYYLGESQQGFVLGFGSTSARDIPGAVRKLRSLLSNS